MLPVIAPVPAEKIHKSMSHGRCRDWIYLGMEAVHCEEGWVAGCWLSTLLGSVGIDAN